MATKSTKPVTRETSAYVRDRGMRPVMVTIVGSLLEFRAKGLRQREVLDVASCYESAVKQRVLSEKKAKAAARAVRKGQR